MKHSQIAFVPKCTPLGGRGRPWFAPQAMRYLKKDALDAFLDLAGGDEPDAWEALKIEGWRIVKVKVTEA